MVITQTRCWKCSSSLETPEARHLGLGETCEANVKAAFEADKVANGGSTISGDKVFNLLSVFAGEEACSEAKTLALGLINTTSAANVTWATMAGCFALARTKREHGDEASVALIFAALAEIAPRMTAMSLGESSAAEGLLDFDIEAGTVTLSATTVRKGSEALCKIAGVKRFGYRQWSLPLRAAVEVKAIVDVRWPFAKVSEAFLAALMVCKELPAIPPAPKAFSSELSTDFMVVTYSERFNGKNIFKSREEGDAFTKWMREEIGACWNRKLFLEKKQPAWLVPADRMEEVTAKLTVLFTPAVVAPRGINANRVARA